MDKFIKNVVGNKKLAYICLALSYLTSILYSYFLSFTERGLPLLDPFNIGLHIFWFVILIWIAWDIHRDKLYVKGTLLFLVILLMLLTGVDYFETESSTQLVVLSLLEVLLLFLAYLTVKIESSIEESVFKKVEELPLAAPSKIQIILSILSSLGLGIISAALVILIVIISLESFEFSLCVAVITIFVFSILYFFIVRKRSITTNLIIALISWGTIIPLIWFGTYDHCEDCPSNIQSE